MTQRQHDDLVAALDALQRRLDALLADVAALRERISS